MGVMVTLPFTRVATFDGRRRPNILMNEDILEWCQERKVDHQWLIGMSKDPGVWKAVFNFQSDADALLFKLTFGGA